MSMRAPSICHAITHGVDVLLVTAMQGIEGTGSVLAVARVTRGSHTRQSVVPLVSM
jgi:hypothetical protein